MSPDRPVRPKGQPRIGPIGSFRYVSTPGQMFAVRVEYGRPGVVVHVAGEVDLVTAPTLRVCLTSLLEQLESSAHHMVLVVDLATVGFMGCAGLHVLLDAAAHAAAHGVTFRLAHCSRPVQRLLELSDVHTHFEGHRTVQDAVASPAETDTP